LSIVVRILVVAFGLLASQPLWAGPLAGRVVNVADGATVTIQDGANQRHTVRLSGIDAPDKAQAFGNRSTSNLAAMVFDRTVTAECGKRDRYGREVCRILLDGRDINLEQVKAGMAWWDKRHDQSRDYEEAQFWAQARRLGLWSESKPIPPWEFRHER
jgi:endonuclease YncB( thermonuclease family)